MLSTLEKQWLGENLIESTMRALNEVEKKIYSLFDAEIPELYDALKLLSNRFKASERK